MQRKIGYFVLLVLCITSGILSWDNVLSDPGPVTRLAEEAACKVKSCADRHGMTKMERNPLGQSAEFTWQSGTVTVECSREHIVFGDRICKPNQPPPTK
ncbi:MAG: hypothetical protein JWM74_6023 [Myxococcaceae bacterium]|jgi:hypothetical protein|nr:hypothetical protein [Myxococcaceae bacterium]